jgi:hypothetical protein
MYLGHRRFSFEYDQPHSDVSMIEYRNSIMMVVDIVYKSIGVYGENGVASYG